jgi:excisionase family DNA binding protein
MTVPDPSSDRFLTLQELAILLKVKERTIYLWAQQGRIPSFKLGNAWRFDRQDIESWIEAQKRNTPRKDKELPT